MLIHIVNNLDRCEKIKIYSISESEIKKVETKILLTGGANLIEVKLTKVATVTSSSDYFTKSHGAIKLKRGFGAVYDYDGKFYLKVYI